MTTTETRIKTARRRAKKRGLRLYKCRGAGLSAGPALFVLTDENNQTVFGGAHRLGNLADVEKYLGRPGIPSSVGVSFGG